MRSSIYDYNGWSRDSGMVPQDWEPGEAPAPYGEVPGTRPTEPEEPQVHRTPSLWRGKRAGKERRKRTQTGDRNGTGGFCLVLALLLILAGVAVYFQGGIQPGESPMEWFREQFWDWDGYYYDYEEDVNWRETLEDVAIPRAPVGDGTTLTLAAADDTESPTAQEIYQQVYPSIVGIRAVTEQGMFLATGVVMSEDGYIITNAHAISGAQQVEVIFSGKGKAEALLVGFDGETDLAVLKVDRQGLTAAGFGDSSLLRVGDPAYAIGNPLGEELWGTMTDGIISALDRTVDLDGQSMTLIQTSAALNRGSSGGVLVNAAGQVVGITNMKMMSRGDTIEGLGFAIPSALVKKVVDQIIATGSYAGQPGLGVRVADHFDAQGNPDGAEVISVKKTSNAGGRIFAGDVIVAAQGEPVTCGDDLLRIKNGYQVGDSITLRIWTGTELRELPVKLLRSSDLAQAPDLLTQRSGEE